MKVSANLGLARSMTVGSSLPTSSAQFLNWESKFIVSGVAVILLFRFERSLRFA